MKNKHLVIDFDSTFVSSEGLPELAAIALEHREDKDRVLSKINRITDLGMAGEITFRESLSRRLPLLGAKRQHVEKLAGILKEKVTPSFKRNKQFFKKHADSIIIISGGFKEFMFSATRDFNIPDRNVFGNTFIYDNTEKVIGFDESNVLTRSGGKAKLLKTLELPGEVVIMGDGYTDYEMKEAGLAKEFILFTENVCRLNVAEVADRIMPDFDEFLKTV